MKKSFKWVGIIVLIIFLVVLLFTGCSPGDITETVYVKSIVYDGNYYEEISIPANEVGVLFGEAPNESNCQAGFVYLFADEPLAVDEKYVHFTVQMPHSYKEGTNIVFAVHFIYNSDQVGTNVRWRISYSWANTHAAFPVSLNIWGLSDASNNDSLVNQLTKFVAVSGAGKKIGSELLCFLSRNSSDALDTYTDTAIFVAVSVLYQVSSPGSTSQWVK